MMATPTEVPAAKPSTDGKLIDRVQQLRLNGTLGGGATGARRGRYRNDYNAAKAALSAAEFRLAEMRPESVRKIEIEQSQAEWDEAEAARVRADQEVKRLYSQKATGVVAQQDIERAEADLKA